MAACWVPRLGAAAVRHQLQKHCYLGKTCLNCKSGIFQTKGQSASLCGATEVVGLEEAELIFYQH